VRKAREADLYGNKHDKEKFLESVMDGYRRKYGPSGKDLVV